MNSDEAHTKLSELMNGKTAPTLVQELLIRRARASAQQIANTDNEIAKLEKQTKQVISEFEVRGAQLNAARHQAIGAQNEMIEALRESIAEDEERKKKEAAAAEAEAKLSASAEVAKKAEEDAEAAKVSADSADVAQATIQ